MYDNSIYIDTLKKYATSFYSKDDEFINQNIDLKIDHTLRVCNIMTKLTNSINLCEEKKFLAFLIALFHDLGRFKQMATYRTFSDKISENHAELSVKELKENKFIDFLSEDKQEIVFKSILNHNKFKIDFDNTTDDIILFSRLIRDADKLDIFKVITDYYLERYEKPNDAIELHYKEEGDISEHIIQDIYNKSLSNNLYIKNAFDMRLLRIGWIFDFNFSYSFVIFRENNYLDKCIEALPKNKIIEDIYKFVNSYISERVETA